MTNFLHRNREKGFSITEIMIAVSISVLMMTGVSAFFQGMRPQLARQDIYFQTNRSVRYALDYLARDINEATQVEATLGADTTGNQVLILELPSLDALGDAVNIAATFDYVTYKLSGTDLVRNLDVATGTFRNGGLDETNRVVARQVQSLQFSSSGTGLTSLSAAQKVVLKYVNVAITSQSTLLGKTSSSQLDADLMLRNIE